MKEKINNCIARLKEMEKQGQKLDPGNRAAYSSGYLQDYPEICELLHYIAEMEG